MRINTIPSLFLLFLSHKILDLRHNLFESLFVFLLRSLKLILGFTFPNRIYIF